MSFSINRLVPQENLLKRPRVSYMISEYIFDHINRLILKPSNILQSDKYCFYFTLSFSLGVPANPVIAKKSPYSTDKKYFLSLRGFTIFEKTTKMAHLTVMSDDIDQNIKPIEYASVVYDMFADYLLYNYKKLKKEMFDKAKGQLNESIINSFSFPAPFDEQKYLTDDARYLENPNDFANEQKNWIVVKDEYMKHYNY